MLTENEVRLLLSKFIGVNKPTILGIVKSVDKGDNTCTIADDGTDIPGVRLRAITGENKGIINYPSLNAYALCVKVEESDEWAMLMASEYDSIEMKINSLTINGGQLGGLLVSQKVVDEMEKHITRINNIVSSLSTLASAMTATAQAPVLGAALGAAITSAIASLQSPLTPPQVENLENSKIKH